MRRGTVISFDVAAGLGELRADEGGVYPFHCTAISDGSRDIEVGAVVGFEVRARLGRWEAWAIGPA